MRANIKENRLVIAVRGAELAVAKEIMSIISTEIVTVSKNYAGITMTFKEREVNGGVARKWWELTPSGKWEKKSASGLGEIQSLSFYSNGVGKDDELVGKLMVALCGCGGSLDDVDEAFALHNPSSQQAFEAYRVLVATRHIITPSMFKRDDWKLMEKASERADIVAEHEGHLSKFEWNTSEQLKVSLMVQGTTIEAGWSIAQGGFGVVASQNDQGFYGKGIYSTSHLNYACKYAVAKAAASSTRSALLVCAIVPGNMLPVVDAKTYYGKHVADGYQSHYTVGKKTLTWLMATSLSSIRFLLLLVEMKEDSISSYPLLDFKGKPNAADELVCFQEAQTLPLFLVVPKTALTFTPKTAAKPHFKADSQAGSLLPSSTQNTASGNSANTSISSAITRAAFEMLSPQELIDYLIVQGVKLDDQKQAIFRQQEIDGEALLNISKEDLERAGFSLGLATKITHAIPSSGKWEKILLCVLAVLVVLAAIIVPLHLSS